MDARIKRIIKHTVQVNKEYINHYGVWKWLRFPRIWKHDLDKVWSIWRHGNYDGLYHQQTQRHHIVHQIDCHHSISKKDIQEAICDWEASQHKDNPLYNMNARTYFHKHVSNRLDTHDMYHIGLRYILELNAGEF